MSRRHHRGETNKATAFASRLRVRCAVWNIRCRRLGGMTVDRAIVMHMLSAKPMIVLRQAVGLAAAKRESRNGGKKTRGVEHGHSGRGQHSHLPRQRVQHLEIIAPFLRRWRIGPRQFTIAVRNRS